MNTEKGSLKIKAAFSLVIGLGVFFLMNRLIGGYKTFDGDSLTKINFAVNNIFTRPLTLYTGKEALLWASFTAVLIAFVMVAFAYINETYQRRVGEEHGSSRWGTKKDIKGFISEKEDENILLTATESLTIGKPSSFENDRNKNILVVGGSGSGKTRGFVKPNIMQLHSSYVVTDPKGTILPDVGYMLKNAGYEIMCFNTINFNKSMHYNPLAYIKSEKDILKVVNVLIENTKGEGDKSGEDFWVKSERLLYSALISYLYYECEPKERTMSSLIKLLDVSDVKEENESWKNEVDLVMDALEEKDADCFTVRQYKKYKKAAGKTAKSILISCGARLAPFDIKEIREITSRDELKLDTIGEKKTALFLIMSDTDKTFNFLIAMIYYQMFNLLCEKADDEHGGRLPVHVRCILDEFSNIGKIPDFDVLIATIRSRGISASIILQSLAQLDKIYDKAADIIIDNCDTLLFLGGKGQKTTENISKIIGKTTIESVTLNENNGQNASWSYNHQIIGRDLIDPAEIGRMSKAECLLMIYGLPPFRSKKFMLENHKRYDQIADSKKVELYDISVLRNQKFFERIGKENFDEEKNEIKNNVRVV